MASNRWTGEFLVAVDEQGRVMLPHLDPYTPRPTHYRISQVYQRDGTLQLVPMKVATIEDLSPPQPDAEPSPSEMYTGEELASLEFTCPFCEAPPKKGCRTRTAAANPLLDSWSPEMQESHPYARPNLVHAKRLELVKGKR